MPLARPTRQIPEAAWTSGFREMTEPWKGAVGCLGVAIFFAMTIGIISWQALEQSPEEWVLQGRAGGVLWERRRGALLLRALPSGRTVAVITVGGVPAAEPPPPRDRCWHDRGQFCYAWEEDAELRLSIEPPPAPATECYGVHWTPLRPDVMLKDCFSMANVSWYGGASIRAQHWPLNNAESPAQPFVSGNFGKNPTGYGPVLERYFLGSTGVTVMVAPDVPLVLSLESDRHFCLQTPAESDAVSLRYLLCVSPDITAAHRHVGSQLAGQARALPDTALLGSPIWRYYGPAGSAAKIKRGLRSLAKKLKRHHLQEGVLALGERSTAILAAADHVPLERRKRHEASRAWDPSLIEPLRLSITLSPYTSIASPLFLRWLRDGQAASYCLSLQPRFGDCSVPLLTTWKGRLCARLNVTSEPALSWYLARAQRLQQALGATYTVFEGAEGNIFLERAVPPPAELMGDRYTTALAAALAALGNATIISAGAGSSHLPFFVQMSPLHSDWSHTGLKGLIPSVLHYSLLGYNFFIPDAVGGSLAGDTPGDPELYVRWLQIVTFLPVMAFSTPPWLCCDTWVLVAPITEKGQTWRDIYLPGEGHLWMDTNTARVFDGGTVLRNYSASLAEVPVFVKTS
ncbi:SITS-binding protein-like isoform X2 [Athene noctua]|uniref:SITS-binding protein-like isoform X2 n=1 Tax=Athene noctua TaxID=126797 RepID=UPI003EBB62E4